MVSRFVRKVRTASGAVAVQAVTRRLSSAAPSLDAATEGVVCAALNALIFSGDSGADAIATAARAHNITQAQVVRAIDNRCPSLKRIVPPGG